MSTFYMKIIKLRCITNKLRKLCFLELTFSPVILLIFNNFYIIFSISYIFLQNVFLCNQVRKKYLSNILESHQITSKEKVFLNF